MTSNPTTTEEWEERLRPNNLSYALCEEFMKEYVDNRGIRENIQSVGYSRLRFIKREILTGKEKFQVGEGESLDDLCILVKFKSWPDPMPIFPPKYRELRVVIDDLRLYKPIQYF